MPTQSFTEALMSFWVHIEGDLVDTWLKEVNQG